MSVSIDTNKLKFVIFGSGHDYTLLDSGKGEKVFFSHPYVPLNSVNYAGQYYFEVPDENGDFFDAVKDDLAHCTFDPPLNTAFGTEGEATVSVHYRREYIHDEETILVEKRLNQKVTVVDHGAVVSSEAQYTKYSDGYLFIHPSDQSISMWTRFVRPSFTNDYTKVSNIPWRTRYLGQSIGGQQAFLSSNVLVDISELATADLSNCEELSHLFSSGKLTDISALADWDVSHVTRFYDTFGYMLSLNDITPLEKWDVSNATTFENMFFSCQSLQDISPLHDWNVSNVTNLKSCFQGSGIKNTHGLENWDVSKVTDMSNMFKNCSSLNNLSGLLNWNTESLSSIASMFEQCVSLINYHGLDNFDVSHCTSLYKVFANNERVLSFEGLENWDTSNVTNFERCFSSIAFIKSWAPLGNWNLSNGSNCNYMFNGNAFIRNLEGLDWTLNDNAVNMFGGFNAYHSAALGKDLWADAYMNFHDYDGNVYAPTGPAQDAVQYPLKDADYAQNWNVNGTDRGLFNNQWTNIPTWN